MSTLIDKIEKLIKREKTTPERKKDDSKKSSNEILSELFGVFNADPPKIDEVSVKKKKSKKKHKKKEKKRSRSTSSVSDTDDSDYSHKRKKRKKSKTKKRRRTRSPSITGSLTPVIIKPDPEVVKVKSEPVDKKPNNNKINKEIKVEQDAPVEIKHVNNKINREIKIEKNENNKQYIKTEDTEASTPPKTPETTRVSTPEPESPIQSTLEPNVNNVDDKKQDVYTESDKTKSKIQIKNLKFSTVYEETVKKAEEEARRRAEKYEEGEYTDSSSSSVKEVVINSQFPKTSDPGGILKQQSLEEVKLHTEEKIVSSKSKHTGSSHKSSSSRHRSKSHKRSKSKSRRSRSKSTSRKHRSRRRSRSKSRHRSRSRRRSRSRTRHRSRHYSPRHRGRRSRSRSPSGVKLADSEKKRLLEVARRNAINMLKNGAVPAGAAVLPPHTRNQVMAAIQSGGKSVDELTDFCKHLSKKEALGELSSVSSNDDNMSENEDTIAFHHPFLVKEKAPIIMSIRGGAPMPVKSTALQVINKEELRIQFPVSSGTQHREKASEWTPVSPSNKDKQIATLNSLPPPPAPISDSESTPPRTTSGPLAILPPPAAAPPTYIKNFTSGSELSSVSALPALPAPGPQVYPPGVGPSKMDMATLVSQKLSMIRKEQEENELNNTGSTFGYGWSKDSSLGQFTGSTDAHILTPKELASGTQAWAKKDQLQRAAPVESGMGMHLLQKMGWTPGQGLGKEGTGTLQPLLLEVKLDTRGLQAKEEYSGRFNRGIKPLRSGARLRGNVPLIAGGKHPVSLLGEYCSKHKIGPPEYNLCFECGPDHKKNFLFKVNVAGVEYQPAVASANKKQAKADAAQLALQKLGILT